MSTPILRSAIKAIMRRNVKCTSSNGAVGAQTGSLSTLSPSFYCNRNNNMGSGFYGGACAPTLDIRRCDVSEYMNIKSTMANILTNVSGNGALLATDCTQISLSATMQEGGEIALTESVSLLDMAASKIEELSIWLISTLKRRKKMMNKHKLRKRRKKLRLKSNK
jgi:hypothetical protein